VKGKVVAVLIKYHTTPYPKEPWYPLDRSLGGPQSQPGHGGRKKELQFLLGIQLQSSDP